MPRSYRQGVLGGAIDFVIFVRIFLSLRMPKLVVFCPRLLILLVRNLVVLPLFDHVVLRRILLCSSDLRLVRVFWGAAPGVLELRRLHNLNYFKNYFCGNLKRLFNQNWWVDIIIKFEKIIEIL